MASPSELSLDCKPQSYSILLKSFGDHHDQTRKLEEFLSRLEEERLKIDAFKRELPLCMQLLINAVEASRQQLQAYRANDHQGQKKPVLEEFIPIKQYANSEENHDQKAANISDKANWMTTAQLWCQTSSNTNEAGSNKQQQSTITSSAATGETDNTISFDIVSPKLNLDAKQRNGGAFLPFSKDRPSRGVTDLALIASNNEKEMEDKKCFEGDNDQGKAQIHTTTTEAQGATANTSTNSASGNGNQTHRKARRCWSPDLHRRFVNALQMLGGSQVATPKQIRELMKVDGLTNDEVKSHLQKYRLHTRRPSCPSPQPPGTPPPHQLVVLGGIWVPPEYATAAAAAAHNGGPTMTTLYSTAAHPVSHAPAHYFPPPVPSHHLPQDHHFYSIPNNSNSLPPPPGYHHGQLLQHQLHVYNSSSQNHSSPESDGRGKGDWSESIEDGTKSESSSWKGESGENRGERKGLAAFREDGEESNGSEITLKF